MDSHKTRIELTDSIMSAVLKMAGGNPGAITVLMKTVETGPAIDPDSAFAEFSGIIALDSFGVYESDIWVLYKDLCHQDLTAMLGLLRARQLGMIGPSELKSAIANCKIDSDRLADLVAKVKDRLLAFGRNEAVPA